MSDNAEDLAADKTAIEKELEDLGLDVDGDISDQESLEQSDNEDLDSIMIDDLEKSLKNDLEESLNVA